MGVMKGFFVLLFGMLLASCRSVPDVSWQEVHEPKATGTASQTMVLEYREDGTPFHQEQLENLRRWLAADNDPLVVFINGWHHNAQDTDSNLQDFGTFIADVETRAGIPVNGLYIGWRGDSVDTPFAWEPSDFWTIWGRKRKSIAIGETGVRDLVRFLAERHRDRPTFVIGHSLGGSVLFRAVKDDLQHDVNDRFEYFMLNPAVGEREFRDVRLGLAALAASRFSATKSLEGVTAANAIERTRRKLTVLQALGDAPVGKVYRLAFLGNAIGFSKSRASHHASICSKAGGCITDPSCQFALAEGRFLVETTPHAGRTCAEVNQDPLWVITGADSVSSGHNDILNSVQADALADLLSRRIRSSIE